MYGLAHNGLMQLGGVARFDAAPPSTVTVTVNGSLPRLTASIALNQSSAANQVAVSGALPRLTGSIALQSQAPICAVSVNGQFPRLASVISLASIAPANQVAISGLLPRLTGAVSLVSNNPPIAATVNGILPRFAASIALNIPGVYPDADASDFTVSATIAAYSAYSSRISQPTSYSAIIVSDFKFSGRLN